MPDTVAIRSANREDHGNFTAPLEVPSSPREERVSGGERTRRGLEPTREPDCHTRLGRAATSA